MGNKVNDETGSGIEYKEENRNQSESPINNPKYEISLYIMDSLNRSNR